MLTTPRSDLLRVCDESSPGDPRRRRRGGPRRGERAPRLLGGRRATRTHAVIPTSGGRPLIAPSTAATVTVATVLATASGLYLGATARWQPRWSPRGTSGAATVLVARAIGDRRYVGFLKRSRTRRSPGATRTFIRRCALSSPSPAQSPRHDAFPRPLVVELDEYDERSLRPYRPPGPLDKGASDARSGPRVLDCRHVGVPGTGATGHGRPVSYASVSDVHVGGQELSESSTLPTSWVMALVG